MDDQTQPIYEHGLTVEQSHDQPPEGLSAPRRRLGRGISSLLGGLADGPSIMPENAVVDTGLGEFTLVDHEAIARNPYQPRKEFDEAALAEMVESIGQHGILQPLLVRPFEGGYQLIAGERRLLAARRAGLAKVPCRVVSLGDREVCEVAMIENVQRTDLNDLEKAQAFQDYLDKFGSTIEELATKLGKNRSTVSNCLRLLELPDFVKIALQTSRISAGHARALLPLEEEADQIAMCQRIESEKLSVRQTEEAIREKLTLAETIPFEGSSHPKAAMAPMSNHILDLQQQLREVLGTKVDIRLKGKESGRLTVHFSSNDEFLRIVGFLRKAS
jgi:ParB family transcriptional regulator, chromosome partitioning protein